MEPPPYAEPTAGSTPPPPPPFGSPRPRQLRRRPDQGPLAGVCAGVAEYFNVDPVIVRIATVVLAFSGPGVFAYVLAWIFVPEAKDPSSYPFDGRPSDRRDRGAQIFGIVLLALSVSILWGGWWSPARRWMFPLGLMALGAWLLLRRDKDGDAGGEVPAGGPSPAPTPWTPPASSVRTGAAGAPDASPSEEASDSDHSDSGHEATTTDTTATDATFADAALDTGTEPTTMVGWTTDGGGAGPPPWEPGAATFGPPPESPEVQSAARRRRRLVFPIVMGALLLWSGLGFLTGVGLQTSLAVALCIVGVGFVLGAFVGGSKALIVPAFLVGIALLVTSVVDIPLSGPVGDRTWVPQTIGQVDDRYELSIGEGVLDLTHLSVADGDVLDIVASVGIGHLVIDVPDGVTLELSADVSAGDIAFLGQSNSGVGVAVHRTFTGDATAGTIRLDLTAGLGQIEVIAFAPEDSTGPTTASTSTTVLG